MGEDRPAIGLGPGLAVSVASISTAAILIRMTSIEPMAVATYRLSISALILLPLVAAGNWREISGLTRRQSLQIMLTGSALAIHFSLWVTSLYYTTVAASVLLVTTSPVFVAILGRAFLGEEVGGKAAGGIAIALVGVAAVVLPAGEFQGDMAGSLLALGGAIAVSVYLLGGRHLRREISLIPYVFCVYSMASVVLLGSSLALGVRLSAFNPSDYLLLLALGIVPSHFGHTLYNYLLRFVDAKVVAVSTLGEPILSSILAFFLLSEAPQWTILVGAPLVFIGIYLTAVASPRRPT